MITISAIMFYLQTVFGAGNVTPAMVKATANHVGSSGIIVVTDQQIVN